LSRRSTRWWRRAAALGLHDLLEQDRGTPPLLRGAGDQIVEFGGGVDQAEVPELITEGRRDRVE
jgi:hypothetical protein